jgi:hypothetical protein
MENINQKVQNDLTLAEFGAYELTSTEMENVNGGIKWSCKAKGTYINGNTDGEVVCEISGEF